MSGNQVSNNQNTSLTQSVGGGSIFDKAMEKHGFNIYNQVKNLSNKETLE